MVDRQPDRTLTYPRLYALLVCPICRRQLRFVSCADEGMYDRATCCGQWWLRPEEAEKCNSSRQSAVLIHAVEVAA